MQIDWITVAAQIVNFLVLVWLLHRFLYGPVVKAMEDREKRIAARLDEARKREEDAEREAAEHRARQAALERDREHILAMAEAEAENLRRTLEGAAREEAEQLRRDLAEEVDGEKKAFIRDMRRRSAEHVLELARRVLGELSDARLEEQMATAFARQIQDTGAELRTQLAKACHAGGGAVTVRSRIGLDADAQRRITRAVHQVISPTAEVRYESSEEVGSGIELTTGSQRLAWTFAGFLDELEQQLHRDLAEIGARHEDAPAT